MSFWPSKARPSRQQFETFYRATIKPLAAHLRQIGLTNPADLEEVLQDTYIEAHKCLHTLQEEDKALAWVFTIGRRQFFKWLNLHKKEWGKRIESEVEAVSDADQMQGLSHRSLVAQVMESLSALQNPVKREAIRLFYLEEWSLKEISESTNTKVSTLTTWMNRFREQIKGEVATPAEPSPQGRQHALGLTVLPSGRSS